MSELMRVTLDERQVREACEIAVRDRVSADLANQSIVATLNTVAGGGSISVEVVITKKRTRKPKATA